jgi:glucan phosphorylase
MHGGCRAIPSRQADLYQALAQVAREQLAQRWVDTQHADRENKARRIYYLSMEFLIGRAMNNALVGARSARSGGGGCSPRQDPRWTR